MDQPRREDFAVLHLDASDEHQFDIHVLDAFVEEELSRCYQIVVHFFSMSPKLPFDNIVGRGAALSLFTKTASGIRVWAGICTELELENTEEHSAGGMMAALAKQLGINPRHFKGGSLYRMVIRPDLWRLSMRTNCRIFQHMDARAIVKEICTEYGIEVVDKTTETYPFYEYRVQYNTTDLDFVERMLQEAGIAYWVMPNPKLPDPGEKKKGLELTQLVLEDKHDTKKPIYDEKNPLPYKGTKPDDLHLAPGPEIWKLSATQRPRSLNVNLRDRDFRGDTYLSPDGVALFPGEDKKGSEGKYESFRYEPNLFFAEKQKAGEEVQDDQGTNRVDPAEQMAAPYRRYFEELAGRTLVRFRTNVLDLEPGKVFQIGTELQDMHPHPAFNPKRKLMVIGRRISAHHSQFDTEILAVYAETPWFPERRTPKHRIYGVQSAVVVGPAGKEIYTDEFGRVRVQFPWDRYHKFDERSSCWIRVSQMWAGGKFGMSAIPRIGHEVLVGFFEGDPDQPIIVGSVYNAKTPSPYYPATGKDAFGDNWTKTGIRTDTSPHDRAPSYNEMMFQDQPTKERIHFQASKDMSYIVRNNRDLDIGNSVSYRVGSTESHDVGSAVNVKVGKSEAHDVGEEFVIRVGGANGGPKTEFRMDGNSITLTTGKASIVLKDSVVAINGVGEVHVHAQSKVHLSSEYIVDVDAMTMSIDTQDNLLLNCGQAVICPTVAAASHAAAAPGGPQAVVPSEAPKAPDPPLPPPEGPGPLDHVTVEHEVYDMKQELPAAVKEALPEVGSFSDLKANAEGLKANVADLKSNIAEEVKNTALGKGLTVPAGLTTGGFAGPLAGVGDAVKAPLENSPLAGLAGSLKNSSVEGLKKIEEVAKATFVSRLADGNAFKTDLYKSLLPSGSVVGDMANVTKGLAHESFIGSVGKNFADATVGQILRTEGVQNVFGEAGSAALQRVTKVLGAHAQSKLESAFFNGTVKHLTESVDKKLGDGAFASILKAGF